MNVVRERTIERAAENRQLRWLAVALVLSMSTWFSTAAVLTPLREAWTLSSAQASWLTIAVQIGFVVGATVSSVTNLADRLSPLRLILLGSIGAAVANALLVAAGGFGPALLLRFATGAFLAGVYPPALKAMSTWFRERRGLALGVMIGALTIGSAVPHLLNGLGGVGWQQALLAASVLTVLGGVIAEVSCAPGPYALGASVFDASQLPAIISDRKFRLASLGYFGHMWELYAMWAWIAVFYRDVLDSERAASFVAAAVISAGAAGSVYAGLVSDRRSRAAAASLALRWSGALSLFIGFLVDAPAPLVVALGLLWGFWVVADSAQFSAIVTETCPPASVGTALTLQLGAGFVLTVFTIFLVPIVLDAAGWGPAFLLLAPGPVVGIWAMRQLERDEKNSRDRHT